MVKSKDKAYRVPKKAFKVNNQSQALPKGYLLVSPILGVKKIRKGKNGRPKNRTSRKNL